jgi:hypothetical protein
MVSDELELCGWMLVASGVAPVSPFHRAFDGAGEENSEEG